MNRLTITCTGVTISVKTPDFEWWGDSNDESAYLARQVLERCGVDDVSVGQILDDECELSYDPDRYPSQKMIYDLIKKIIDRALLGFDYIWEYQDLIDESKTYLKVK